MLWNLSREPLKLAKAKRHKPPKPLFSKTEMARLQRELRRLEKIARASCRKP